MSSPSRPPLALAVLIAFGVVLASGTARPAVRRRPPPTSRRATCRSWSPDRRPPRTPFAASSRPAEPGRVRGHHGRRTPRPPTTALRDRDGYAAFVLGPTGVTLHTASAASPAVAQLLSQAARQLGGATGQPVQVVDVVPRSPGRPARRRLRGRLPAARPDRACSPAIALALRVRGRRRAAGRRSSPSALLAGLVGATVLQSWLGVLAGDYLLNAGRHRAVRRSPSPARVAGLGAVLGRPGLGARRAAGLPGRQPAVRGRPRRRSCCRSRGARSGSACRSAPAARCCARPRSSTGPAARPRPGCSRRTRSSGWRWCCSAARAAGTPPSRPAGPDRRRAGPWRGDRRGARHGYGAWRSGRGARGRPPARSGGELTEHHPPRKRRRCGLMPVPPSFSLHYGGVRPAEVTPG